MPARITVCYTDQPAMESYLYEQSGYLIGRAKECQLILEHPTVSRQHARVSHSNDAWQLNDQRSLNGDSGNDRYCDGEEHEPCSSVFLRRHAATAVRR